MLRSKFPGALTRCLNYECRDEGYRRIDGYERYDGRPSPSEGSTSVAIRSRRNLIEEVPGEGDILGVWRYKERTWSFRKPVNSDLVSMFGSTEDGWEEIDLGLSVGFEQGNGEVPPPGATVAGVNTGRRCTLQRAVRLSGSWQDGSAKGFLIVKDFVNDLVFSSDEPLVVGQGSATFAHFANGFITVGVRGFERGFDHSVRSGAQSDLGSIDDAEISGRETSDRDILGITIKGGILRILLNRRLGDDPVQVRESFVGLSLVVGGESVNFAVGEFIDDKALNAWQFAWDVGTPHPLSSAHFNDLIEFTIRHQGAVGSTRMKAIGEAQTQSIGLAQGAKFRFANENFYGQSDTERMYGVSGTGRAFEFDGEVFVPIFSGVEDDKPTHIAEHQAHLFLAYRGGSLVHSALGEPLNYEVINGAGEIATGREITNLVPHYQTTLIILGIDTTQSLQGTSSADWELRTIADDAGAMENSAQLMEEPVYYDDRGVSMLSATDRYGDLSVAQTSERIRPILDAKRRNNALPIASVRVRSNSQYRLFFDDGFALVYSITEHPGARKSREYACIQYIASIDGRQRNGVINNICSIEDKDGRERIFASMKGSGYVYEMDKGTSFDGLPIRFYLRFGYNDFRQPGTTKTFKKISVEGTSEGRSRFRVAADFDDDTETGERPDEELFLAIEAGRWDESSWDEFTWDTAGGSVAHARIAGRGRNMSVVLYGESAVDSPHVISGITIEKTDRKKRL